MKHHQSARDAEIKDASIYKHTHALTHLNMKKNKPQDLIFIGHTMMVDCQQTNKGKKNVFICDTKSRDKENT